MRMIDGRCDPLMPLNERTLYLPFRGTAPPSADHIRALDGSAVLGAK